MLSEDELRAIWQSLATTDYGAIVKLPILTGPRRDEVAGRRRSEVCLDDVGPVWRLPGARTNNGRAHDVPLSRQAVAVLMDLPRTGDRDHVFGRGDGPFSGWSRAKRRLDEASGGAEWTLHDLRRTAVTNMAELGVTPHVVEAVVNHLSGHKGGVAGIYKRASYGPEKRQALQRWGDRVEEIVAAAASRPIKVLQLRSAPT